VFQEELRSETDRKLQGMQSEMKEEYKNAQSIHQATSSRIASTEQSIATLMQVVERVSSLETALKKQENDFAQRFSHCNEENRQLSLQLDQLQQAHHQQNIEINAIKTAASKLDFVVSENDKRLYNALATTEKRMADTATRDADEANRKLHVLNSKVANDLDAIQKESANREAQLQALIRKARESSSADIANMRRDVEDNTDRVIARCNERIADEMKTFKLSTSGKISVMQSVLDQSEEHIKSINTTLDHNTGTTDTRLQCLEDLLKKQNQGSVEIKQQLQSIFKSVAVLEADTARLDQQCKVRSPAARGDNIPPFSSVGRHDRFDFNEQQPTYQDEQPLSRAARQTPQQMSPQSTSHSQTFPPTSLASGLTHPLSRSVPALPTPVSHVNARVTDGNANFLMSKSTDDASLNFNFPTANNRQGGYRYREAAVGDEIFPAIRTLVTDETSQYQRDSHQHVKSINEASNKDNFGCDMDIRDIFGKFLDIYREDQLMLKTR
jgi:chromosome segregation ATPase